MQPGLYALVHIFHKQVQSYMASTAVLDLRLKDWEIAIHAGKQLQVCMLNLPIGVSFRACYLIHMLYVAPPLSNNCQGTAEH